MPLVKIIGRIGRTQGENTVKTPDKKAIGISKNIVTLYYPVNY